MHGPGKARTLHMAVPFKDKRNSNGEVTGKLTRITAADLLSNGRIANTFAARLVGRSRASSRSSSSVSRERVP